MMNKLRLATTLALFTVISFTACKKDNNNNNNPDDATVTAQTQGHNEDQNRISGDMDAMTNEINAELEASAGFSGRGEQVNSVLCNATTVADTMSNPRTLTITFNGPDCSGARIRQGVVVISMAQGVRWKNPNAAITVNFQNLKIKRVIDNKTIKLHGSYTFTNVTGGLLIHLSNLPQIIHTIQSPGMSITFPDSTVRSWQVARQRKFTYNNGVVLTVTGTHTAGNQTGIAEWGTDRFGAAFTTAITQPIIARQDCAGRITAGQITHTRPLSNAVVTFGLDANGNPTTCPGVGGTYYFKLVWTGPAGQPHTHIAPY